MIKRNKNIFKILATGITINMFLYAGGLNYVSAADLSSEQNEVTDQNSSTTNIDGMIIENGVLISGKDAEGDVKIPSNVNKIASDAFWCNDKITTVEIPDGVTEIGMSAFTQCKNLTKVNIPGSVKVISPYAFTNCSLSDVVIEDGVETIDQEAFSRCYNLQEVELPESLESIGDCAFQYCNKLTNVKLKSKIKTIGNSAFYGCTSLTEISIPDNVISIGDNVFKNCSNMTNININPQGMTIGSDVFPIGVKINGNNITHDNSDIPSKSTKVLNPGWNYIDGYWYYADDLCNMYRNQWYFNGHDWYYLSNDGKMYGDGPVEIDGAEYIFKYSSGELLTGWQYVSLKRAWFYFNPNSDGSKGAMVKSKWIFSEGKWYYLTDTGAMAKDRTIDGYYVDSSGAWVK